MTRVDELYADLKLLIREHEMFDKAVEENKRLKDAIKDIRADIINIADGKRNIKVSSVFKIIDKHIGGWNNAT